MLWKSKVGEKIMQQNYESEVRNITTVAVSEAMECKDPMVTWV